MFTVIDLSQPLRSDSLSYPGTSLALTAERVDIGFSRAQVTRLSSFDLHAGTHMDSPLHFSPSGSAISDVPLEPIPAILVSVSGRVIDEPHIPDACAGAAVLFSTGWERTAGTQEYYQGFPYLTEAAARALVQRGATLVGLDSPSVDAAVPDPTYPAHTALCGAGILIVEGLVNLSSLEGIQSPIHFLALPLRLEGIEASPVRAVAVVAAG